MGLGDWACPQNAKDMTNKVIEEALAGFRAILFNEIRETVEESGGRVEISVDLPSTIDSDRYYTVSLTAVLVDEDSDELMVESWDDDGDSYKDAIDVYSVDELLKIVEAL